MREKGSVLGWLPTYHDSKDRPPLLKSLCQNQGCERGAPFSYSKADASLVPPLVPVKESVSAKSSPFAVGRVRNSTESMSFFYLPEGGHAEGISFALNDKIEIM